MLTLITELLDIPPIVSLLVLIVIGLIIIGVFIGVLTLICYIISKYVVASAKEIMDYKVEVETELQHRGITK